jgi:hypothetical protein
LSPPDDEVEVTVTIDEDFGYALTIVSYPDLLSRSEKKKRLMLG